MTWQPKSSLTVETLHLDLKQHGFCASPLFLQTLGPWFPNEMQNLLSSEKRTLDHQATVQFVFLLSPGKMLLTMFLFQLGSPFPEDVGAWWPLDSLNPASVHSSWSSPKCLNQLCLTVFSSLRSYLLLVHLFLSNFFLPVNFAFNTLYYSTLWRPLSNEPLWLTLFVEGVKDRCSGPLPSQ